MNENSQTVDNFYGPNQPNFAKFINDFMQVYLLSTCTYTHIMRPNFELKNANKATIAHTLSLAFLQL